MTIPFDHRAFDFLLGTRTVRNRRLAEWLAGSDEWIEFTGRPDAGRKILNGLGLVDQLEAEFGGEDFEGVSLRIFDPSGEQWTIYGADTSHPRLTEQVVGTFEHGVGKSYGEGPFARASQE